MDSNIFVCNYIQYRAGISDFSSISLTYCKYHKKPKYFFGLWKISFLEHFSARLSINSQCSCSCWRSWITSCWYIQRISIEFEFTYAPQLSRDKKGFQSRFIGSLLAQSRSSDFVPNLETHIRLKGDVNFMTYKKITKMINALIPNDFMIIDLQTLGRFLKSTIWYAAYHMLHVTWYASMLKIRLADELMKKPMKASVDFVGLTNLKKSLEKRTEKIIYVTNERRHKGMGFSNSYSVRIHGDA